MAWSNLQALLPKIHDQCLHSFQTTCRYPRFIEVNAFRLHGRGDTLVISGVNDIFMKIMFMKIMFMNTSPILRKESRTMIAGLAPKQNVLFYVRSAINSLVFSAIRMKIRQAALRVIFKVPRNVSVAWHATNCQIIIYFFIP